MTTWRDEFSDNGLLEDLNSSIPSRKEARLHADMGAIARQHGLFAASAAYQSPGKPLSEIRMNYLQRKANKQLARATAAKWVAFPNTRLKKTQWVRRNPDPDKYQVPDWKLLENAFHELRRAVKIKRGHAIAMPGQRSLEAARFDYWREILYREALDKQTIR